MEVGRYEECICSHGQAALSYVRHAYRRTHTYQRFKDYAAAFFLLGDSLKDCVSLCLKQLDDFHLAVILARVYEGDDGPVLRDLLSTHVVPLAFAQGHRRLACWGFWMLKRRDLAVRVIIVSYQWTFDASTSLTGLNRPLFWN